MNLYAEVTLGIDEFYKKFSSIDLIQDLATKRLLTSVSLPLAPDSAVSVPHTGLQWFNLSIIEVFQGKPLALPDWLPPPASSPIPLHRRNIILH